MTLFKDAARIVCLQKEITYEQMAKEIGMAKKEFKTALYQKTPHPKHHIIAKYLYDNLDTKNVSLRVHCALNGITIKEYCKQNNLNYYSVVNDGRTLSKIN